MSSFFPLTIENFCRIESARKFRSKGERSTWSGEALSNNQREKARKRDKEKVKYRETEKEKDRVKR